MKPIKEQKCPSCGAAMRFDPKQGKLVCDYCGTITDIDAAPQEQTGGIEGFDFNSLSAHATDLNADALPVYNCESCGAEVIAAAEQAALTCPYCGNNIVLTDKVSGKLRPDGLIPFKLTAKDLPARMTQFYKNKKLLPRGFFSESKMGKITGVYVPFWVFSGRLFGELNYSAENVSIYQQGDYEVTDTDHYRLSRDVSVEFGDLPVDASGRIDDELMDSLEPFDMLEAKDFDMRYLAGFTADRFDQAKNDISARAERRMRNTAESAADRQAGVGYDSSRRIGGRLKAELNAKYLLFPVYLFDLSHRGKNYSFAVNGQTGKVVGTLPIDGGVSFGYFLRRVAVILLGTLGVSAVMYFLGR
ncbi:MAG: TFIIB-type zinc ribbon-containing protein [Oscillospiraceae bacterium]|nr:TFIIB-type zinc ribbon-containing protein [Oscillospiraceae bacterium]